MFRSLYFFLALLVLSGCSVFKDTEKKPEVTGKRIAVLQHSAPLEPDPIVAGLPIALPPAENNTAWPVAGGYPDQPPQHPALAYPLERLWRADIGAASKDDAALLPPPVVMDKTVATLDGKGQVTLLDARTGARTWRVNVLPENATPPAVPGGLAHTGNTLIAASGLNDVVALKTADGSLLWRTSLAAPVRTAPTVANGNVYVVTADNELVALDLATGKQKWSHQGLAELTSMAGGAAPAVAGDMVLAAYSTGELVALLADNGRVLWFDGLGGISQPFAVASLADIVARPVIDKGLVFALSHNGTLAAINARSGQRVWTREIGGTQQPGMIGEWLIVLNNDNQLIAMTRDGRVRWNTALPRFEDPEDKDDPILWYGPVLAGGKLLVAGSNGELLEIQPASGSISGRFRLGGGAAAAPVIANGIAYVVTREGELIALR